MMPDERRDEETRDRLDTIQSGYERFNRRATRILRLNVVVLIVGGLVSGYLVQQNGERVDDIQQSRRDATRTACVEQNARHDGTISTLDKLLKEAIKRRPKEAKQIRQSRTFTILLIEALAPRRDCEARVKALVQ